MRQLPVFKVDIASPHTLTPAATRLLAADEPCAVTMERPLGTSDFVLSCDHASRRIPRVLGTLGLTEAQLRSHIAWDIGAAEVARRLAQSLDATLVMQNYSRLVIDCNRPPGTPDSIPGSSESVRISGNEQLRPDAAAARRAEIFEPYHAELRAILEQRQRDGRRSLLLAVHSFTPSYHGISRPWQVGVMYRHDARLGTALLQLLRRDQQLQVGDNEPYAIEDDFDYSLPLHGESRGIAHAGLEIRQDLIAEAPGQSAWAERLASLLAQSTGMLAD